MDAEWESVLGVAGGRTTANPGASGGGGLCHPPRDTGAVGCHPGVSHAADTGGRGPLIPPPACERGTPRAEAAEQLSDGLWGAVRDWADEQPGPVTSLRVIESALGQVCARVIGTQLGVRLSEAQVAQIISDVRTWLRGVQERVNPENADGA